MEASACVNAVWRRFALLYPIQVSILHHCLLSWLLFTTLCRLFLRKLKLTLKIPVLALVDSDPYGLKILSVYMKGSMNMSYDSRWACRHMHVRW
jgi:hypothetical protein